MRSEQPTQPDGWTEVKKAKLQKNEGKHKTVQGGYESRREGQEGSMKASVAATKDMSVIDLTSDSSAQQVKKTKKKRRREENLRRSHDRVRLDELTRSGKKRKASKDIHKSCSSSSSSSSNEAQGGNSRSERQQANPDVDAGRKRSKKRKCRKRRGRRKSSGDEARSDTPMDRAQNGKVGEERHRSRNLRWQEGSPPDNSVRKGDWAIVDLTSDSSPTQDQGKRERREKKKKKKKSKKL